MPKEEIDQRYNKVVEIYSKSIELKEIPRIFHNLVNRAIVYNKIGLPMKAIEDTTTAISSSESTTWANTIKARAFACRAMSFLQIGDLQKAETDANSSLELFHGARAFFVKGCVF